MSSTGRRFGIPALAVLVLVAALAAVLVWQYGVPQQDGDGDHQTQPSPEPGAELTGPLNLLLAGVDTRPSQPTWSPKADAVMVLHVPAAHDSAYLFSLPRDLLVDVPAFPPADFPGQSETKLTHAMSYGSQVPGQEVPDPSQGLELLRRTVSDTTGIAQWDAAAVLNFPGFTDLVDAVGGVDVQLDQRVVSAHRQPDGSHRPLQPDGIGYMGPQKVYEAGEQHLEGWEALDLARQRNLEGGDYARQQHQRLLVESLVQELFTQDLVTDPGQIQRVRDAVGDELVFDGRAGVADFAFALQDVRPERIESVSLSGTSVVTGGAYQGEQLTPESEEFLAAVREDRVEAFLADHPDLVD